MTYHVSFHGQSSKFSFTFSLEEARILSLFTSCVPLLTCVAAVWLLSSHMISSFNS